MGFSKPLFNYWVKAAFGKVFFNFGLFIAFSAIKPWADLLFCIPFRFVLHKTLPERIKFALQRSVLVNTAAFDFVVVKNTVSVHLFF